MKKDPKTRRRSEDGIALLIAIFVLLLISVVAIALLVSSGTETALGANYRSSSTVYYAALAGLEETRGRLIPKNPNYFGAAVIPTPFPLGQTVYVLNRLSGENITPWDSSNPYYDNEYGAEFFPLSASSAGVQPAYSVWDSNAQGIPGPLFKWVRITAATEQSLYLDVDSDGAYDHTIPIYYDPAQVDSHGNPSPSLIKSAIPPPTAVQVLQVTAMAYSPNGSKKLLQYLVAPIAPNLSFPAALTMDGNNVGSNATYPFSTPDWAGFFVKGIDQFAPPGSSCVPGVNPVSAIGYTNGSDASQSNITAGIGAWNHGDYQGWGSASPNVNYVAGPPAPYLAPSLQTVAGLDSLVATISANADIVVAGPATQSVMPAAMSATNPMTIVVNGDLTVSGWHSTGYGLLLVTGTFTYDPDATWNGIVLVIGKGIMYSHQLGSGQIIGAVLVASTVDASGNPLPPYTSGLPTPLGSPSFDFTHSSQGQGIYYSSCWVQYVQSPLKYQVLSFHEIPQ
jgi:hypothetical protein